MEKYVYLKRHDKFKNLKRFSISELILIMNNKDYDKYDNNIRKCAEVELKERILHLNMEYDDLVHLDDKVIKERGIDLEGYLLHPYVSLQNLMETYFVHCLQEKGNLLFSEKHLCNESNFGEPFFSKVCNLEIQNLEKRIKREKREVQKQVLMNAKNVLENRKKVISEDKKELVKDLGLIEMLSYNDALQQINGGVTLNLYNNITDEGLYNLFKKFGGAKKYYYAKTLNDGILDIDIFQYLYGLHFVKKDSKKLCYQQQRLLYQARYGFEVDYGKKIIQNALQDIKEQDLVLKKVK